MFGGKIRREGGLEGLLQVQDKTTITTSTLANVSDEQIVQVLEKLGVTDVTLDHPRRTLEQVFLEMVDEATKEGLQTYGARSGRDVAKFLQGEEGEASAEQQREVLIESLVSGESDKPAEAETTTPTQPDKPAPPPPPSETDSVLADLTGEAPSEPESEQEKREKSKPAAPPQDSAKKPTDAKPDADSGVIDDLLNG